jgi:outer membrane protein OmpA-like peptidoglycan-associated protein
LQKGFGGEGMKNRMLLLFILIVMSLTSANAQTWDRRIAVGPQGNIFKLWGGANNRSTISSKVGFHAFYGFRPNMQLGLDFGYGSYKPSESGAITPKDGDLNYRTTVFPVNVTVRATPLENDIVKPYGLVGAGLLFWNLKNLDTDESVHGSQSNMTLSIAAGVEWLFATAWALDLRAQNTFLLDQKLDNTGYGDDANSMMLEGRVGVSYYLGSYVDTDGDGVQDKFDLEPTIPEDMDNFQDHDGAPDLDNDNDGIPDELDGAPNRPEDPDGFQDEDGIPDLDNDNDGVPDEIDGAPLDPEDRDNFQDEDGVPDPDNDNDGVLDVNDGAPNDAEDLDGFEDADGVPDPDNDGDGINDVDDQCPDQAETKNGYQDEDGCPDDLIPEQQNIILQGVNFESGSSNLTAEARNVLRTVANQLLVAENIRLRIVGYTDNTGNAQFNRRLSQDRADAVKNFLVSNGIQANRLLTEGRGADQPIADNSTDSGRARNRRIEFERID